MYRSAPDGIARTLVHRPAPAALVYAAMALLAVVTLPAFVLAPTRAHGAGTMGLIVFVAFELGLLAIARRRVVVEIDPTATRLTLRSKRWPLAAREVHLEIAELRDVVIQTLPRNPGVRLALALRDGSEVPLTRSYFGNLGQMERDAAAIRTLCDLAPRG